MEAMPFLFQFSPIHLSVLVLCALNIPYVLYRIPKGRLFRPALLHQRPYMVSHMPLQFVDVFP